MWLVYLKNYTRMGVFITFMATEQILMRLQKVSMSFEKHIFVYKLDDCEMKCFLFSTIGCSENNYDLIFTIQR